MIGTTCYLEIASNSSCSTRHSAHQVPHTFTTYTCPLSAALLTMVDGSITLLSANSGAGLPISGEGSAWRSRLGLRPNANNTTSATNAANGSRNFHIVRYPI